MDNTKEQPLLSAEPVRSRGKLPLSTKLLYALPTLGTASIIVVISTSLLTVYNDRNVTVSFIAITQFVAGLVASYLQLILGYLGDRTTSRFGRRRPYMLFGAPFVAVAVVMLYLPVGNHRGFNSAWFAVWYTIYATFGEFVTVPYNALGTELTQDDNERKSVYTLVQLMLVCGLILGTVLNLIFTTLVTIIVAAGILLVSFVLLVVKVPEKEEFKAQAKEAMPMIPGVRSCMKNHPWVVLMLSGTTLSLVNEIVSMFQYLVQYQFHMKVKNGMAILMSAYIVIQLLGVPLVFFVIRKFGKLAAWRAGALCVVLYGATGYFLSGVSIYAFAASVVLFSAGLVMCNVCVNIFTSDTIDYDELLTGKRRESSYHSIGNLPSLFFSTAGKAMPLIVLSATGFVTDAKTQSHEVVVAIRLMLTMFPALVLFTAWVIFRYYTLDEEAHEQISQALEDVKQGRDTIDPMTRKPLIRETLRASNASTSVDVSTYLLYFTPNDIRMLASRWKTRVVVKFVGAATFWGIDTIIAAWASIVFLMKGHQQVAFVGLTLGTLFSIGLAYELARLQGIRWAMSLPKADLVSYAQAYMYQQQSVQMADNTEAGLNRKEPSERAVDAMEYSMHNFTEGAAHGQVMLLKALCRFFTIHTFCFGACLVTLLVALGHIHV